MVSFGEKLPPTSGTESREFWTQTVKELKEHPGEFGNIGTFSPGVAGFIRRGDYAYFLPARPVADAATYMRKHWAVTARKVSSDPHRSAIYVMWTGKGCSCEECG